MHLIQVHGVLRRAFAGSNLAQQFFVVAWKPRVRCGWGW